MMVTGTWRLGADIYATYITVEVLLLVLFVPQEAGDGFSFLFGVVFVFNAPPSPGSTTGMLIHT